MFDLRLLEIDGCDLVLGMDWIDSVALIMLNTKPLGISFIRDSQVIHLLSDTNPDKLKTLEAKEMWNLLHKGQCNYVAQLMMVEAKGIDKPIPEEI